MKTKLLFITLFIGASLFTFAQSLALIHEGELLEPNTIVHIVGGISAELIIELDVKNTNTNIADSIDVYLKLYENPLIEGHTGTFCWADQCFPPFVTESPIGRYIQANSICENEFSGHLNPYGTVGTSIIAYTFFDINNTSDSVQVIVEYYAGVIPGIGELNNETLKVSAYPNPATDFLNISINSEISEVITYELLGITGSVVKSEVVRSNEATFYVSELADGLYLFRVSSDKNIINTGRVIIKH